MSKGNSTAATATATQKPASGGNTNGNNGGAAAVASTPQAATATEKTLFDTPVAQTNQSNAVAPTSNAVVTAADAGISYDLDAYDVDDGFSDFKENDSRPQIVVIASSKHPQTITGDPAHIPGLVEGDFLRTVDGKHWKAKEGLYVIPCAFRHIWIEKEPSVNGLPGAYVNSYGENTDIVRQALSGMFDAVDSNGKKIMVRTDNQNIIRETICFFCLNIENPENPDFDPIVLSLTPGHFAQTRKWVTAMKTKYVKTPNGMRQLFLFAGVWRLTTGYYKGRGTAYQSLCHDFVGQIHEVIGAFDPVTKRNQTAIDFYESAIALRKTFTTPNSEDKLDFSAVEDDSFDPSDYASAEPVASTAADADFDPLA